jgi:hypothetical protein
LPFATTDFFFTAFFPARTPTVFCYAAIPCPSPTPSSQTKRSSGDWSVVIVKIKELKGRLMAKKAERKSTPFSRCIPGLEQSDNYSAIAEQYGGLF